MEKIKTAGKCLFNILLGTRRRKLEGPYLLVAKIFGFLIAAFYAYTSFMGMFSPESHRAVIWTGSAVLCFLMMPALPERKKSAKKLWFDSPMNRFTWLDALLVVATLVVGIYFVMNYPQFFKRTGNFTDLDAIMSWAGILLSLEAARRGTGAPIPLLAVFMILYATPAVGQSLGGLWAHKGFPLERVSTFLFTTFEGVFGIVAYTMASYIIPFIIFGAFMTATGVGRFFIELPYAVFGRFTGGAALVATMAGLLMGMLSGSPIANVLAIGAFMLPLCAKAGYDKETSGGIVSAAASGAMIMPPVMGSAAFFMSEFTGISYFEIAKMALIPACMFYLGMLVQAYLHAKRHGLKPVPKADLPDWRKVVREDWYLCAPIFVLVGFLANGFSPALSSLYGSLTCIIVSLPKKKFRMTPTRFFETMAKSSMDIMIIGCITGAIGVIIGIISLTGLGGKFTEILLAMGGGMVLPTVGMVALAAIVLGMGAPIGAVYLILAALVPPALLALGVSIPAAHMIIMWFSQLSGLTPPVCLVAYAAASMNGARPFRTGFLSLKYGSLLLIVPLMFVYTKVLEFGGLQWYVDVITGIVAIFFWGAFMQGYLIRRNHLAESLLFGAGALMLFAPMHMWNGGVNLIGVAICLLVTVFQIITGRRQKPKDDAADLLLESQST